VHELLYTNDGGWQHNELSAPPAVAVSQLNGYETTFNDQQHVNYLDSAGHVHELWYSDGSGMTNVVTENVWNGDGVTGGGVSEIFARPSWQDSAGVPASISTGFIGRGVPDIAGNADPASGYPVFINGQSVGPIGGTSATAPLYAGLIASINTSRGRPVGYLNVNLYALAGAFVFRDIADGRSNASGSTPGYTSHAGWDACTGLGSIDGTALLSGLLKVLP
jgi:kumamolisin